MNKIENAFKEKCFIPFITCGDPDLDTTKKLILEMDKARADIIELGIPFSDPTAEGPVIQKASQRALANGVTVDHIFEMVHEVRKQTEVPLVFMTYANVVYSYGIDRFMKRMKEEGMNGIILPDVPYEEKEEFETIASQYDIAWIRMVAPTSKERVQKIAKDARGFIYVVSSLGVTGQRTEFSLELEELCQSIREVSTTPLAIGFGISAPEHAKNMSKYSDGVISGSAIVKLCEKYEENCIAPVYDFVHQMKQAVIL